MNFSLSDNRSESIKLHLTVLYAFLREHDVPVKGHVPCAVTRGQNVKGKVLSSVNGICKDIQV